MPPVAHYKTDPPERPPAALRMAQAQTPLVDPAFVYAMGPGTHTGEEQYPDSAVTMGVDMRAGSVVCRCGLRLWRWSIRDGTRRFWRRPKERGLQCDVMVWENNLAEWIRRFPDSYILEVAQPVEEDPPEEPEDALVDLLEEEWIEEEVEAYEAEEFDQS